MLGLLGSLAASLASSGAGSGALSGLTGALGGGTKQSVSTSQQVNTSVNTNVNPIIAVQTPAATFDGSSPLDANTSQTTESSQTDDWRTGLTPAVSIPSYIGTDSGLASSTYDNVSEGGLSALSSFLSPTTILVIGAGLLAWMLWSK